VSDVSPPEADAAAQPEPAIAMIIHTAHITGRILRGTPANTAVLLQAAGDEGAPWIIRSIRVLQTIPSTFCMAASIASDRGLTRLRTRSPAPSSSRPDRHSR